MSDVLIRGVPSEDLEEIRAAATREGTSLQRYLLDAVHAQAVYLRRQEALTDLAERLDGEQGVPAEERDAVLDAVEQADAERAEQLGSRRE